MTLGTNARPEVGAISREILHWAETEERRRVASDHGSTAEYDDAASLRFLSLDRDAM